MLDDNVERRFENFVFALRIFGRTKFASGGFQSSVLLSGRSDFHVWDIPYM